MRVWQTVPDGAEPPVHGFMVMLVSYSGGIWAAMR